MSTAPAVSSSHCGLNCGTNCCRPAAERVVVAALCMKAMAYATSPHAVRKV